MPIERVTRFVAPSTGELFVTEIEAQIAESRAAFGKHLHFYIERKCDSNLSPKQKQAIINFIESHAYEIQTHWANCSTGSKDSE